MMAYGGEPTFYSILESRRLEKKTLERKCTDKHLVLLSKSFTSWKELSAFLGLTQQDEEDIHSDNIRNSERRIATLRRWSEKFGEEATYFRLGEAFEALKWRGCIGILLDLFQKHEQEILPSTVKTESVTNSSVINEERRQETPASLFGNELLPKSVLSSTSLAESAPYTVGEV